MKVLSTSTFIKLAVCAVLAGTGIAFAADDKPASPAAHAPKVKEPSVIPPQPQFPPIDINTAKKDEFKKLNGVTEAMADRIIAGRPYLSKYVLVTDKIIPEDIFQSIKQHIVAKQPDTKKGSKPAKAASKP